MAAGLGSRYGGLKQLDAVGPYGQTIIDYSVYDSIQAGFGKIVFVIRTSFEQEFRDQILSRFESRIPCECVYQDLDAETDGYPKPPERTKPWGTGHATLIAESAVELPFSVINADDYYGRDSLATICKYLSQPELKGTTDFAMVGFTLRNTLSEYGYVSRGICRHKAEWYLETVVETTRIFKRDNGAYYLDDREVEHPLTGNEIASMNFWGFTPEIFGFLRREFHSFLKEQGQNPRAEFYLPTVVNTLVNRGEARVKILPTRDSWFGITYREDLEPAVRQIRSLIRSGLYPEKLWDTP
mgnify:CR=1 FL=1